MKLRTISSRAGPALVTDRCTRPERPLAPWYDISHVDASNLPMRVEPVDLPSCRVLTCAESLLPNCPAVGQLKDASGTAISCFSPDRDDQNSEVAQYFEKSCKDAYSWSGDDSESVAACAGEDYDVVFCP